MSLPHLRHQISGRVFPVGPEDFFDAIFRRIGPGSFEEGHRAAVGDRLDEKQQGRVEPWSPEPGRASEAEIPNRGDSGDDSFAADQIRQGPRRRVQLQRQVAVAAWARMIVSLPDYCDCVEDWTLHGLGPGKGFAVELRSKFSGAPFVEHFVMLTRYRVSEQSRAGEAKVDAEVEIEWASPHPLSTRIEKALVEAFQRSFETAFLPLVGRFLTAHARQPHLSEWLPGDAVDEPREFQLSSARQTEATDQRRGQQGSIAAEYDLDWSSGGSTNDLRVEVLAASDLAAPEYRVGDLTKGFSGGPTALLSAVYVELELGERKVKTSCASNPDSHCSVGFESERVLFAHSSQENQLRLWVRDKRGLQSALRGDPLVGEAVLLLGLEIADLLPRWVDLPIQRAGSPVGTISLRYQLLAVPGAPVVQSPSVQRALQALPPVPAVTEEALGDEEQFETPPGSPRELER